MNNTSASLIPFASNGFNTSPSIQPPMSSVECLRPPTGGATRKPVATARQRGSPLQDLKSLELLVRLSECRSYTETAKQMEIGIGTVSKIINRLERELGVRLLNRNTRLTSLTHQGEVMAEKAKRALYEMAQAVDLLHLENSEPVGVVKALMNSPIAKGCILPMLSAFQDRYPKVELEIGVHDGQADLVALGFDVAITDGVPVSDMYVARPLCTLPLVTVASPDYLKRHGIPSCIEELANHDCINVRLPSGDVPCWNFVPDPTKPGTSGAKAPGAVSFTPKGRLILFNQYDAVVCAAVADLGIALTYAHAIRRQLERGELKVVLADYRIEPGNAGAKQYYVQYSHRKYVPMAQKVFVDFLLEEFRRATFLAFDARAYAA
jgi:DNA-binding transcriptional LysR family regulator